MCKNNSLVAEWEKHLQNSIKELSHEMDWAFDWKRPAALFQMFLLFLTKLYIFLVVNVKIGWLNNFNSLYLKMSPCFLLVSEVRDIRQSSDLVSYSLGVFANYRLISRRIAKYNAKVSHLTLATIQSTFIIGLLYTPLAISYGLT
jgi:hypothetical protein